MSRAMKDDEAQRVVSMSKRDEGSIGISIAAQQEHVAIGGYKSSSGSKLEEDEPSEDTCSASSTSTSPMAAASRLGAVVTDKIPGLPRIVLQPPWQRSRLSCPPRSRTEDAAVAGKTEETDVAGSEPGRRSVDLMRISALLSSEPPDESRNARGDEQSRGGTHHDKKTSPNQALPQPSSDVRELAIKPWSSMLKKRQRSSTSSPSGVDIPDDEDEELEESEGDESVVTESHHTLHRTSSAAAGSSDQQWKGPRGGQLVQDISYDDLRKHFHKPLPEVAKEFGIPMYLLKRICRKNGIKRWPHWQGRQVVKKITREELESQFGKPMEQVAEYYNLSLSGLRKICRKNGITRWPVHPKRRRLSGDASSPIDDPGDPGPGGRPSEAA